MSCAPAVLLPIEVPYFDPFDGGVEAQVLFLLEKPGPMTAQGGRRGGSGFISRDNDDPTAEATFQFMRQAGVPRKATAIWNVVPRWNGTRAITADELEEGKTCLKRLFALLKLRAVVMVGGKAAKARGFLETTQLPLFESFHPGPIVRAIFPEQWKQIPSEWAKVLPHILMDFGQVSDELEISRTPD